ncbi:hypothetical protein P692DRAFT_20826874 [Suillus brevipes Sb2]|nr:hypothetical protein P692DRAFT_20826874 [Suillus brevipes Sb2]
MLTGCGNGHPHVHQGDDPEPMPFLCTIEVSSRDSVDLPCQNAWGAYALGNVRCKQALGDED